MVDWNTIVQIFKLVCTLFTIILVAKWVDTYCLDEDMTVIENSSYYDDDTDVFPVMSLCFVQRFKDKQFERFGRNIKGSNYEKYLYGEYFDKNMTYIDYDSVSTNISDYMISSDIYYRNGDSPHLDTLSNLPWKPPYESYSWNCWEKFLKCFAFEVTDKNIHKIKIYLRRDIFPNQIRPQNGGFAVMFHYPNQILASIHTVTRQWPRREKTSNYWMDFNIKGMNVVVRRYKERLQNCIPDWKNYDSTVLDRHIEAVGCKAPYQRTSRHWPICNDERKMKNAQFPIEQGSIRPCREIEWIDYQTFDSDAKTDLEDRHIINLQGKDRKQWFCIVLRYLNNRFDKTISKRKVDFQSLVGYIGGYIGMFTGLALAQIPEMLLSAARLTTRFSNCICRHLEK